MSVLPLGVSASLDDICERLTNVLKKLLDNRQASDPLTGKVCATQQETGNCLPRLPLCPELTQMMVRVLVCGHAPLWEREPAK